MSLLDQHRFHPRRFADNRFVYPVVSRRSQGVSIGVNLNPDKICNFDCIYCQVDRRSPAETTFVELDQLLRELDDVIQLVTSGDLYQFPQFQSVPEHLRRLNDIAFSGDGEPTTYRNFDEIIMRAAAMKQQHGLHSVRLVLITNASMFHREVVQRGLAIMDANQGEIWAKLDAGTAEYFHLVERTPIPFQRILDNLLLAATVRPLVIQSLFLRFNGEPPNDAQIAAYVQRLRDIISGGGCISLVQVYTVARPPAESSVTALTNAEVDAIVARVRDDAQLPAAPYYGG